MHRNLGHPSNRLLVQILKEAILDNEKYFRNIIFVDESGASIYSGIVMLIYTIVFISFRKRSGVKLFGD